MWSVCDLTIRASLLPRQRIVATAAPNHDRESSASFFLLIDGDACTSSRPAPATSRGGCAIVNKPSLLLSSLSHQPLRPLHFDLHPQTIRSFSSPSLVHCNHRHSQLLISRSFRTARHSLTSTYKLPFSLKSHPWNVNLVSHVASLCNAVSGLLTIYQVFAGPPSSSTTDATFDPRSTSHFFAQHGKRASDSPGVLGRAATSFACLLLPAETQRGDRGT